MGSCQLQLLFSRNFMQYCVYYVCVIQPLPLVVIMGVICGALVELQLYHADLSLLSFCRKQLVGAA